MIKNIIIVIIIITIIIIIIIIIIVKGLNPGLDSEDVQVVETSVTVNNNSPLQSYVHPGDHTQPSYYYHYYY